MRARYWGRRLLIGALVLGSALGGLFPALHAAAQQDDGRISIIFMHHSTGLGMMEEGGVRPALTALGYDLWDHGYNDEGLRDPEGNYLGVNWDVPDDNTDPDGWYAIFQQPFTDPPSNTLSHMLQYDVIIFKSCFPTSDIASEEQLQEYQRYYLAIRDVMDRYPDKIFIPFTPPPLVPNATTPENAARARRWAQYLTSDEYLAGHPNVFVFDFFNALADEDGYLRAEYRGDEWDSHPNTLANQTVGPLFVQFVDEAIRSYTPGEPLEAPTSSAADEPADTETAEDAGLTNTDAGDFYAEGLLPLTEFGDFEIPLPEDAVWDYVEEGDFTWEIVSPGYDSDYALMMRFDMPLEQYAGWGVDVTPDPAWAETGGLSFDWRADQEGMLITVSVAVRDPQRPEAEPSDATPFGYTLYTEGEDWAHVFVPWDAFERADWWGDEGVWTLDPANVVWVAFDVGSWEGDQQGTVWVDNLLPADE